MNATTTSLAQLESHLWEAANILRGPVDAADFKTYIFPLLFFKRISDVMMRSIEQPSPNPKATRNMPGSHRTTGSRYPTSAIGTTFVR
ncbi:MAG: type I restriction-modification system subunit M N-terminal domain-containing protein [Methanomicrobiaceae archaeon]|uniref:Type i restriction-modification system, dna-methyltransferase subunit m n=1 Tax=hydrocarbon metagenome TaxID=938273 RepID=A0A0W8FHI4_9ZZZZ|nr:type I restriction-modification system subunit M N-terminal domain-containing protein [Methanomicrobiaceae archaeon]MDD5420466.1 type I restriction-modification system subunit M N-terminal domain-containing protein [Methanomicrobiaceae archaeon]